MNDGETLGHGFVSPWFTTPVNLPIDDDYFPNDYPIDENLVIPAGQQEDRDN